MSYERPKSEPAKDELDTVNPRAAAPVFAAKSATDDRYPYKLAAVVPPVKMSEMTAGSVRPWYQRIPTWGWIIIGLSLIWAGVALSGMYLIH